MRVAIFDFDGTIYKKETFPLLMNELKKHPTYRARYKRFYRSILFPYISYKLKLYPERKMKYDLMQRYVQALDGWTKEEVTAFFKHVVSQMENDWNDTVVNALHKHAEDGLFTMVVSGAFTPLLEHLKQMWPIQKVIGTELYYEQSRLNSKVNIDHVQEERKVQLIKRTLQNKNIDWENSFAYGDSFSDVHVLRLVGNPVAIQPDAKLKKYTEKHGWTCIE